MMMKFAKKRRVTPHWGRIILVVGLSLMIASVAFFTLKHVLASFFNEHYYKDIVTETISENMPSQVHIEYPVTGNETVNQLIKKFIDDEYNQFNDQDTFDNTLVKELHISYEAIPYNLSFVSFFFNVYENNSALAHGIHTTNTFTFDMETGNIVQLKDLFDDEASYVSFENILRNKIVEIVGSDEDEEPFLSDSQIDEVIKNTRNFSLTEDALVIHYDPYIITPGYMSTQVIETSLEFIEGLKVERLNTEKPDTQLGSNALQVYDEQKQKELIQHYKNQKLIALTFDDGPHRVLTPKLLEILKAKNVKATFFVLGSRAEKNPEIVQQAADEGHTIGSHGFTHLNLVNLSEEQVIHEVKQTQDAIQYATGYIPNLLRPPYGAYNDVLLNNADAAIIMWSVDPMDWKYRDSTVITQNVLNHVKDGSIVLMHDIHQTSVDAVPDIIDSLTERGYTFVTVDTLLQVRQGMENSKVYFSGN